MTKEKTIPISVERALGCSILGTLLLNTASTVIKEHPAFFPSNLKNWYRKFNEIAAPTIWRIEKLKKLFVSTEDKQEIDKQLGREVDAEEIENDLNIEQTLMSNFIFLYLKSSTPEIYDLNLYVENLLQRKKLYTEEEVEDKLKALTKQITVANYDTKFYKQFLTH